MTRKPRSKLEFHNIEHKLFGKHIKRKNTTVRAPPICSKNEFFNSLTKQYMNNPKNVLKG